MRSADDLESTSEIPVVVVGGGFAGSLTAMILQRRGFSVVLLERGQHPRFAIGESSTPTANFILRDLAIKHDLPQLLPLCKFGTWQRTYPEVGCGLKRGFSYFQHQRDTEFVPSPNHHNELLVAASSDNDVADTHWLRADVDAFLFQLARSLGVRCCEQTQVVSVTQTGDNWHLVAQQHHETSLPAEPIHLQAGFLIDATGRADDLQLATRFRSAATSTAAPQHPLRTHSRAIFGHFKNLPRWHDVLTSSGIDGATRDHPFGCDDAALHHVLDEGWIWWIRFANNITSVGLVVDEQRFPLDEAVSPEVEWNRVLSRYPTLNRALQEAVLVIPDTGLIRTARLQRRVDTCVGTGWAMLPHTVGFIDPMHSTGIALSLAGIDRVTSAIIEHPLASSAQQIALESYQQRVFEELDVIDQFVSGAYAAIAQRDFSKFVAFSMSYFAAATTWERRRLAHPGGPTPTLFLADDPHFRAVVNELTNGLSSTSAASFERLCAERLAPFNHVGLFEPPVANMYGRTAV